MTAIQPTLDHKQLPPEGWQQVMLQARQALQADPRDAEARQALEDAVEALNTYEQEGVPPETSIGQDISTVGKGFVGAAKQFPAGLADLLGQIGEGDIFGAVKSVGKGLANVGRGALAPLELALRELSGEAVQQPERQAALEAGGGSLLGLGLLAAPGRIAKARAGKAGPAAALPGAAATAARGARGAGPGLETTALTQGFRSPAAAIEPSLVDLPGATLPLAGLEDAFAASARAAPVEGLLPTARGGTPAPAAVPGLVQGATSEAAPALTPIAGTRGGFSVEGPPTPPVPSAPTIAEIQPQIAPKAPVRTKAPKFPPFEEEALLPGMRPSPFSSQIPRPNPLSDLDARLASLREQLGSEGGFVNLNLGPLGALRLLQRLRRSPAEIEAAVKTKPQLLTVLSTWLLASQLGNVELEEQALAEAEALLATP